MTTNIDGDVSLKIKKLFGAAHRMHEFGSAFLNNQIEAQSRRQ